MKQTASQWAKVYIGKCKRRMWEKQLIDIPKLIQPEELAKIENSEMHRKVVALIDEYSDGMQGEPSRKTYTNCHDFFLVSRCMQNWQRTGPMSSMTLGDIKAARQEEQMMIVNVMEHKTGDTYGPAPICFPAQVFAWLKSFLKKAIGNSEVRKRYNATLLRKSVATKIHSDHPELIKDSAELMTHSVNTAARQYCLIKRNQRAATTSRKLQNIMTGKAQKLTQTENVSGGSDEELEEEISEPRELIVSDKDGLRQLFNDEFSNEIPITIECVRRKLESTNITTSLPKKIVDALRYISKRLKNKANLPTEEENPKERFKRIGIKLHDATEYIPDEDDDHSSISKEEIKTKHSYYQAERDEIIKDFRDIIESDAPIREACIFDQMKKNKELKHLTQMLNANKLAFKVRTEWKIFRRNQLKAKK